METGRGDRGGGAGAAAPGTGGVGAHRADAWHPDCDFDSDARGRYIDAVIRATRPGCHGDSYCADECACQSAAAIAAADANCATAYRLALPDARCCHDPGDCTDVCGAARAGAAGHGAPAHERAGLDLGREAGVSDHDCKDGSEPSPGPWTLHRRDLPFHDWIGDATGGVVCMGFGRSDETVLVAAWQYRQTLNTVRRRLLDLGTARTPTGMRDEAARLADFIHARLHTPERETR